MFLCQNKENGLIIILVTPSYLHQSSGTTLVFFFFLSAKKPLQPFKMVNGLVQIHQWKVKGYTGIHLKPT